MRQAYSLAAIGLPAAAALTAGVIALSLPAGAAGNPNSGSRVGAAAPASQPASHSQCGVVAGPQPARHAPWHRGRDTPPPLAGPQNPPTEGPSCVPSVPQGPPPPSHAPWQYPKDTPPPISGAQPPTGGTSTSPPPATR